MAGVQAAVGRIGRGLRPLARLFRRTEAVALLPVFSLWGYWIGGEAALIALALLLPLLYLLAGGVAPEPVMARDSTTGLLLRDGVETGLDRFIAARAKGGKTTACLVLSLDGVEGLADRFGHAGYASGLQAVADRLLPVLRGGDVVARLDGATFAVAVGWLRESGPEPVIRLAARLQEALEAPFDLEMTTIHPTCAIGFCLDVQASEPKGAVVLAAAEAAMAEARRQGPSMVRGWTGDLQAARDRRLALANEIGIALDSGQIRPYFQPQISTDTGRITGFEALARWLHPVHGIIPPDDFLPIIAAAGLEARLGQVILFHALSALHAWDRAGLHVPRVAVNLSCEELRDPRLSDRLKWELDRFALAPDRLVIEVLETVVADAANEVSVLNVAALARAGCGIDLDDFGSGHASIANIRRFAVQRLKIDRSFVSRIDVDREQQRLLTAILSMAERLGIETLAEGVETPGEHALLSQLGCGHVQGFGIGRPMPFDETLGWIRRQEALSPHLPLLGRRAI